MRYGQIAHVDKPVSRLVFGTAIKVLFDAFRSVYGDAADFDRRLHAAFELLDDMYAEGVNCFDCADHYGEEPLGEWLEARELREKVVILTKGAHHNRWRKRVTDFDILHDVHNSLAKLKTDHIDIYLLHRDDPTVSVAPLMDALNRCVDEGKLMAIGASNWTIPRIEAANDYALKHGMRPFTVSSPHYSLAEQVVDPWGGGCVTLTGPSNREARAWYAENRMPVFAYSTMARGFFSGRFRSDEPEAARRILDDAGVKGFAYPDNFERLRRCELLAAEKGLSVGDVAMAWLFNQRALDVYALTSPSRRDRMHASIAAAEIRLSDAECRWLDLERDSI